MSGKIDINAFHPIAMEFVGRLGYADLETIKTTGDFFPGIAETLGCRRTRSRPIALVGTRTLLALGASHVIGVPNHIGDADPFTATASKTFPLA